MDVNDWVVHVKKDMFIDVTDSKESKGGHYIVEFAIEFTGYLII